MKRTFYQWSDLHEPDVSGRALARILKDARKLLRGRTVVHFEVLFDEETFGWLALVEEEGA